MEPNLENIVLIDKTPNLECQTIETETDAELVKRCKTEDMQAFERLFKRYQKRIYNFILYQVQASETAADLTQEVFFLAWRNLSSLRKEEAFLSWLYQIARNHCRNFQKKRRLKTESLEELLDNEQETWEIPDDSENPEKLSLSAELQTVVKRAISNLREKHRTVIILHYVEGLEVTEIAEIMEIPSGTVKSRLARAREKLSDKLAKYVER